MKIKMLMMIIATNESTMIAQGCSYQAGSLLVFVGRPFGSVVVEDDRGWSEPKRFWNNDVEV